MSSKESTAATKPEMDSNAASAGDNMAAIDALIAIPEAVAVIDTKQR